MNEYETERLEETARQWVIRTQDASFADWDALTEWLEAAPTHLAAYEAALDDDRWVEDLFRSAPSVPAVEIVPTQSRRSWKYAGAAAAAVVVAAVGGWAAFDRDAPMQQVATAVGEHRTIALADGSKMTLNSGTRVAFDADTPRAVELVAGEALFDVRHDARDPFVVTVGATRLVDAGTVFNVVRQGDALDIAVSHGAVIYAPGADQIRLDAGAGLSRASANDRPVVRVANVDGVGSWQAGQLQYDDDALDRVSSDLSRNLGAPIAVSRAVSELRFSGTLILTGSPEQVLARAGPLLGVRFTKRKDGWEMTQTDAAP